MLESQVRGDVDQLPGGDQVRIAWAAPSNASNRQPYIVEQAAAPDRPWSNANTAIAFTPTGSSIAVTSPAGAVFRVALAQP